MFSTIEMPSPSSLFSAYASMAASVMLFRSMANELIPHPVRSYLLSRLRYLFKPHSSDLTLVIEDSSDISINEVYDAAQVYLCTKINPNTERIKISKTAKEKNLAFWLENGEEVIDFFDGVELKWNFVCVEPLGKNDRPHDPPMSEKRFFELTFHKKYKEKVLGFYIPFILEKAKVIEDENRVLKMYTLNGSNHYIGIKWQPVNLEHPATFNTIAMEPELKSSIIEDLNRFVKRKEFYKRVGRAWKRGYLLYGPPGTGKSSLIAAMANYLKFDVYDLQLASGMRDSDLRKLLLTTGNRSILVIEDIDCSVDLPGRGTPQGVVEDGHKNSSEVQVTLSGLLNFIDGLWSSCGDERIIVLTTNHKDRLDPALLRAGRMDMHIHMSYCTYHGFKLLASNYLGIQTYHHLFGEIDNLLQETEVTPAQVAEELMKSEEVDVALEGLVKLLKRKKLEEDDDSYDGDEEAHEKIKGGLKEAKRQKKENKTRKINTRNRKMGTRGRRKL